MLTSPPLVSSIMTRDPVWARPTDTLRQAIERMRQRECRRLPVLEGEQLVGIITDRDVRLALNSPFILRERHADQELLDRILVAECMTPDPICLPPEATVVDAARLMREHKFGGVPIVSGGRLVGILTITDVLTCFINLSEAPGEAP